MMCLFSPSELMGPSGRPTGMVNFINVVLGSLALLVAASGCDGSGSGGTGAEPSMTFTPGRSDSTSSGAFVTEIPTDLRLPHEGTWPRAGTGPSSSPLPSVCVDPPPRLTDVAQTDGRSIQDGSAANPRTESLGVWADSEESAEAIKDWLGELALCGGRGPQSHTGLLVEWAVAPAVVEGADEAWTAYQQTLEPNLAVDERVDLFCLVARVGNAVYAEVVLVRGGLDQVSSRRYVREASRSVAAFMPALAIFDKS